MTLIICESLREIGEMACVTSAWPSRGQTLNPLNLSHETKRDGKVTTEEHVERNKDGFFRFRAAKSSLKVQSTVVFGIPLKWNGL